MSASTKPEKILFIHGNYPGQFRHLAALCGADPGWNVKFLTKEGFPNKWKIPGVEILVYQQHRKPHPNTHHYVRSTEESVLLGQAVLRQIYLLIQNGFHPDIVVFHAGMGLGLFLRDLLPKTKLVGYFEWYFQPNTSKYLFANYALDQQLLSGLRNLVIEHELLSVDVGVVPTRWQYSQFPSLLQPRLEIIFDGIDTAFFKPCSSTHSRSVEFPVEGSDQPLRLSADELVLTYATRGMEPLRGFPEFMRSLPHLFKKLPRLRVLIAGKDRQAYSYQANSHNGSWKEALLAELGEFPGREQIHFTGSLIYRDYRELLWRSDLHCYFSRPYVTSWSLFEAVACGTKLCLNKGGATEVFVERADLVVDLDVQPRKLAEMISQQLQQTKAFGPSNKNAISQFIPGYQDGSPLPDQYHLARCLQEWRNLLTLKA